MNQYRAAIVGLTGIGAGGLRPAPEPTLDKVMPHSHAAAYAATPGVEIVAVCDLVPNMIERFRGEWGTIYPNVRGYTDFRQMLASENIDLLSVATSDHRHADIVVEGAKAGVKGIFCEKPIATNLADADRMIAACKENNTALLIDHTRRWYPDYQEARRILRSGEIGHLLRIIATLSGPRAMLFRNGTHLIDTVCFFAEAEPLWAWGQLDDEHANHPPRYAGDGGKNPATDPGGSGYVHFANGVRAFINSSKGSIKNFELDLLAESGRIRIGTHLTEIWREFPDGSPGWSQLPRLHTTVSDAAAAVRELINLIENGGQPSSSGDDGRRALSILLALVQSNAADGARVDFPVSDI